MGAAQEGENIALFLHAGRIRADVSPPAKGKKVNFQVKSPTATASVRGTEFDMDSSNVKMYSGTVAFAGSDGVPVMVNAGQSGFAGGGQISFSSGPALPLGIRSPNGGRPGLSAPPEGSVTGRIGWYGRQP